MPLQVIGSGFGRTGTLSMKGALEQLGVGPCYHMEEVFKTPSHAKTWADAAAGTTIADDWHTLFRNYRSTVDFPASVIWKELWAAFPDAKILHTVRDPERWWESTNNTIYRVTGIIEPWLRTAVPPVGRLANTIEALIWDGLFDGRFEDKDHAIAVFESFTADVIASVPADQLLVYQVGDGWEPLCEFLDLPVPNWEFPHLNDTASMQRRLRALQVAIAGVKVAGGAAVVGAAAVAARRTR